MVLRRFEIETAAPFRLDLTAWALRRRPHNAVDRFDGTWYRRLAVLRGRPFDVAVRQETATGPAARLAVELSRPGGRSSDRDEADVRILLRRILGLDLDLDGFYRLAARDSRLTTLAARFVGMRPPRFPSVFEALVNAMACQQLSLTVGIHLLNRLAVRYGDRTSPAPDAPRAFPTPERLAGADPDALRAIGFSRAKARAIVTLGMRVAAGELDLEALCDADDATARAVLLRIGGVGRWSTEYTLLRGLGRLEVLPGDDIGARNNLRRRYGLDGQAGYDELSALARSWSPYGGLVYFHLLLDALSDAGHVLPTAAAPPTARRAGRRWRTTRTVETGR